MHQPSLIVVKTRDVIEAEKLQTAIGAKREQVAEMMVALEDLKLGVH